MRTFEDYMLDYVELVAKLRRLGQALDLAKITLKTMANRGCEHVPRGELPYYASPAIHIPTCLEATTIPMCAYCLAKKAVLEIEELENANGN